MQTLNQLVSTQEKLMKKVNTLLKTVKMGFKPGDSLSALELHSNEQLYAYPASQLDPSQLEIGLEPQERVGNPLHKIQAIKTTINRKIPKIEFFK